MPISDYMRNLRRKIGTDRIMMPAVSAIIVNDRGEVLLHRSKDDGKWYVIGGALDPGEEVAHAVIREVFEETGLIVQIEKLSGVFVDPVVRYGNGDEVFYVATTFLCRPVGGQLRIGDDESLEVRYFRPDELPELMPTHRQRIETALAGTQRAYYSWDEAWLKNW
jgi:8-oxo-dGTP diphosphatase